MDGVRDSRAGLTALDILGCTISDLRHLSSMSALQELHLRHCSRLTRGALPALQSLTRLTYLDVIGAGAAAPDKIEKLVEAMPRLCVSFVSCEIS